MKKLPIINIDLNILQEYNITPSQFCILKSIEIQDIELFKLSESVTDIIVLETKGYLFNMNDDTRDPVTYEFLCLTEKYVNMQTDGTEEYTLETLTSIYPKSELRHGQRVVLQKSFKRINALYNALFKDNPKKVRVIIDCIKYMLEDRQKAGSKAQFLPDLEVWLRQERWKAYEEIMNEDRKIDGERYSINL